jgi:hypothetical protein
MEKVQRYLAKRATKGQRVAPNVQSKVTIPILRSFGMYQASPAMLIFMAAGRWDLQPIWGRIRWPAHWFAGQYVNPGA